MAWMVYLIVVTARTVVKVYDPYEILGVSRVSCLVQCGGCCTGTLESTFLSQTECR